MERIEFRKQVLDRLRGDLVGPLADDEVFRPEVSTSGRRRPAVSPTERYLSGILFPQQSDLPAEEEEDLGEGGADEGEADVPASQGSGVSLHNIKRPSSAGVSFAVNMAESPIVALRVLGARYVPRWEAPDGSLSEVPGDLLDLVWCRVGFDVRLHPIELREGRMKPIRLVDHGVPGLEVHLQVASGRANDGFSGRTVTAVMLNSFSSTKDRLENESNTFFQVELRVSAGKDTKLVPRPARRSAEDPAFALLYRNVHEYAAGHTCSADWTVDGDLDNQVVKEVRTSWVPVQEVESVSEKGDDACTALRDRCFNAEWLSNPDNAQLLSEELSRLPGLYLTWLDDIEQRDLATITDFRLKTQARKHLAECRQVASRIQGSIKSLEDEKVRIAFQMANRAMVLQFGWANGPGVHLNWRPFQLGFQLLVLRSLTEPGHAEREIMDLLWFPTGGGKTEAYLWLVAFTLLHRRLRSDRPDDGAGTGALMRYTLRLLTIDQFQRATRSIMALEHLRRQHGPDLLGHEPFSVGLWVGGGATPNRIADVGNPMKDTNPTPRQLVKCPCCGNQLRWGKESLGQGLTVTVRCESNGCPCKSWTPRGLPIYTVDEDIYRARPSLVIGTIDKFAQIAFRAADTMTFFGDKYPPPDLILQDELHLISGPLGSLAGVYEAAIDELCTRRDDSGQVVQRAKIIGSTATIKRAHEQIRQLFNREACQFPHPVLDARFSFFARPAEQQEKVGRFYVAVTTAGRSPKFSLQAVYASLLQSGIAIPIEPDEERDPWWTLLGYFNSLRELGGSLVMLSDDVPISMSLYASARGEAVERNGFKVSRRSIEQFEELTSRRDQIELRDAFDRLKTAKYRPDEDNESLDAVLATNMVSVGVDVDRLGAMCIYAQPKQTAEYIQASSRVGRKFPGLIAIVYKNSFARDRSRYETFRSWNQAFYRDVEPSSVTPFAPRARDKALHAAIVAIAAVKVPALRRSPLLTPELRVDVERTVVTPLLQRARRVDAKEFEDTRRDMQAFLDRWQVRSTRWIEAGERHAAYKNDRKPESALLISAEEAAARLATMYTVAGAVPTPNSMRDVEASTPFKLVEKLRTD
jgi:Helicase conserved C-terminal domain